MEKERSNIDRNRKLKLIFIGSITLMCLLLGLASYNGIQGLQAQSKFINKEIKGVQISQDLMDAIYHMQKIRGLEAFNDKSDKLNKERKQLNKYLNNSEWLLFSGKQTIALTGLTRNQIISSITTMNEKHDFEGYTHIINQQITILGHILDASNLILDPELETYALMDLSLIKIPAYIKLIGEIRGIISSRIKTSVDSGMNKDIYAHLYALKASLASGFTEIDKLAELNSLYNPDAESLKNSLEGTIAELETIHSFNDANQSEDEPFDALSVHLDQIFEIQGNFLQRLNILLQKRLEHTENQKLFSFIGIFLAIFAYIIISLYYYREQSKMLGEAEDAKARAEQARWQLEQTQEAIIQSEKMAALGGLVAGVAHEINTPVGNTLAAATHLSAQAQKILSSYAEAELTGEELEIFLDTSVEATGLMESNCRRAASLIQSFKQVAVNQSSSEQRHFDIKENIEEILLSYNHKLKQSHIAVKLECPYAFEIFNDPGVLDQILTNFISNSLLHGFDETKQGEINIKVVKKNTNLELIYSDTGKGIPDKIANKVFDPFFTTKRGKGGSGLGLNIVYNLVHNQLRGNITLGRHESGGVQFTLFFPANNKQALVHGGNNG